MNRKKQTLSPDELKAAVLAALPDLLPEWLPDGEFRDGKYIALNPHRDDRNLGSFQIDVETGAWRDYAINEGGSDGISLHAYLVNRGDYKASWRELSVHQEVLACAAAGSAPHPANAAKMLKAKADAARRAKRLYDAASDLKGHPAEVYLTKVRGLKPNKAWRRLKGSVLPFKGFGQCPLLY